MPLNQASGQHQWTWTSVEPLECTSLSIKIRSRDGQTTSEWSNTQILQGQKFNSYIHIYCRTPNAALPDLLHNAIIHSLGAKVFFLSGI